MNSKRCTYALTSTSDHASLRVSKDATSEASSDVPSFTSLATPVIEALGFAAMGAAAFVIGIVFASRAHAQPSAPKTLPGQFQLMAPLKLPINDSFLGPDMRARMNETAITYTYEFAVTNGSCDKALTPEQCLQYFNGISKATIRSSPISLQNVDQAFDQIDNVLIHTVSRDGETAGWSMLRTVAVQARETIAKRNENMREVTRKIPASVANLYRELGISRVEFRCRTIITGNRLLVETSAFDMTPKATINTTKKLGATDGDSTGENESPRLLMPVAVRDVIGFTDDLARDLDRSMESLNGYAAEAIAKKQKASN